MKGKTIFNIFLTMCLFAASGLAAPDAAMAEEPETPAVSEQAQGIAAEVVETEAGIYYTIKKGDTLWDLSRKFADSPYLWPDLWSENSKIANPHRIYPGQRIQLYRRTDTTVEPVVEEVVEAKAQVIEPEPEIEPEPLPVEEQPEPEQKSGVLSYSRVDQVGFIREIPVKPHGKIFKVQGIKKEMIATDDVIYIMRHGDRFLVPGKRYTIYRTPNKVWDRKTEEYIGTQHYLLGIAEITQVEPDYAVGKVLRAYSNIRIGDLLMPYERRMAKIPRRQPPPGLNGEIIMAEQQNLVIGDHVIAFINRGRRDGVEIGHIFDVYYQERGQIRSRKRNKIVLQPVVFAEFVVLHTEETTSTVYVTDARQNISPGTKFRTPVR